MFYNVETLKLVMPASLISAIHKARTTGVRPKTPHIGYYLGESNHTSEIKDSVTKQLLEIGFIWMEDCEQCKEDGTLARKQEKVKHLAIKEAEAIVRQGNRDE